MRGAFSCAGLVPGSYRCSIRSGLREIAHYEVLIAGDVDAEVHWVIPAGGTIRVRATSDTNAQVEVVAQGSQLLFAEHSGDGAFLFNDVELGAYTIRYITEASGEVATLSRDGQVVDLTLPRVSVAKLAGTVIGVGEAPVPDAWVSARPEGTLLAVNSVRALTDAEGRFELPNLPRGEYQVRVESLVGSVTTSLSTGKDAVVRLSPEPSSSD